MKKLFGILGSVVLCAVMACVALTGCGDKTPKMEVVCEWNMGVDEGTTFQELIPGCNLDKIDNAEAKDGKAIEVTVTSAGYASILVTDMKTPMKATELTMKVYASGEATVWLELTEYDPWEHLFAEDESGMPRQGSVMELKSGWNEYKLTLKRAVAGRLNTFCFKTTSSEAVTFLIDTVVWEKPAE